MSEIELKSCPFCGGKAGLWLDIGKEYSVRCKRCDARMLASSAESAIKNWNCRIGQSTSGGIEWIPVSEKLPRLEEDVLVTVRNKETGTSAVWNGVRYKNGWAIASCHDYIYLYDADSNLEVITWTHLPEA